MIMNEKISRDNGNFPGNYFLLQKHRFIFQTVTY